MNKSGSKTLFSIALYIGITMLIVVVSLSGLLYAVVEQKGLEIVRENNAALLNEVGYHLSYVNQINTNYCRQQFNDSDVQSLLTAVAPIDSFDATQIIRRIAKTLPLNEMVESVLLYNGRADIFYSTDPLKYQQCIELVEMLRTDKSHTTFSVIPRKMYNEATKQYDREVLTYIMTERDRRTGATEAAVAANISTKWMLQNLASPTQGENGRLMLVRKDGRILLDAKESSIEERFVEEALLSTMQQQTDSIIQQMDEKRVVISYLHVPQTEWILMNVQPYDDLIRIAQEVRDAMLLVMLFSLVLGLPLTLLLAQTIYRPFGKLFHHVAAQQPSLPQQAEDTAENRFHARSSGAKKEIDFLLNTFDYQNEQLHKLEDYRWSAQMQLNKSRLKTALLENGTHTSLREAQMQTQANSVFEKGDPLLMVLLVISNFNHVDIENVEERNLIRFAVSNVAEEVLQQYGTAQAVPMSGGEVVVLVRPHSEQDTSLCRKLLEQIAENLYDILNLMVSSFADTTVFDTPKLSECYRQLQKLSRYTLIYGVRCVVLAEELAAQQKIALDYPQEIERKLFEAISGADAEQVALQLKQFIHTICEGSIESYFACVAKLQLAMQSYVKQLNQHKLIKVQVNFGESFAQIQQAETSEQIFRQFSILATAIMEQIPYSAGRKNEAIVSAIQQYIEEHYADKELCGKMLAGNFDISTAYMGMLFKERTGCSVQEYINRTRLDHAQKIVLETNLQIAQIIELCGLETSSFYRLYKARFGVSPKEQRMQTRLQTEVQKGTD